MAKTYVLPTWHVFGLCLILVPVLKIAGENAPQSQVPDAFMIFGEFADSAAVKDVNHNPMFKCLRITRTEYEPEVPFTTYSWSLNAGKGKPRKTATVNYTSGDAPDVFFTTVDSDPSTRKEADFLYSDYTSCGVIAMESFGHQCTLWVPYEQRYSYPEECNKIHAELCGESVSLFDKELCDDSDPYSADN
ncbi:hypothetical protein MTO96_033612 [Rhipicephalus appendiculatus]